MISLTPLIDVVFILLIFFMLASSFLDWRSIDLGAAAKSSSGSSLLGALLIEIPKSGQLRLAGEILTHEQLLERVQQRLEKKADQRVLIKPYPGVAVQETVVLLDQLSQTGVSNIALVRGESK